MILRALMLASAIFLTGCGGSGNEQKEAASEFTISPLSSQNIQEASIGVVIVESSTNNDFELVVEEQQQAFIQKVEGNRVYFVAPNVTEESTIQLLLTVKEGSGIAELTWETTVLPFEAANLSAAPKPNVFSTSNLVKHEGRSFDSAGIPLYLKDGYTYYYPVSIAQYTYDLYNHYNRYGDDRTLDKFLTNVTWLRDNCVYTDYGFCSFRAYFSIDAYKLDTDWTTAMGQGQAISSLIAAHYITGDNSFAEVAFDALSAFRYPISEKGLYADFDGNLFYEEYGSEEMPAHVLNGFLFSLSGINDFYKNYQADIAKDIFDIGVESAVNLVELYNFNFTSRYDYSPLNQLASTKGGPDIYHEIHIFQLAWLYSVSSREEIKDVAAEFLKQDMAGIRSIINYEDISTEILNLEASHTIDASRFGVDKLTDANWTWDKYWSSHRGTVNLDIQLNDDILLSSGLERIVMTATSKSDLPKSFDLLVKDDTDSYLLVKQGINLDNAATFEYEHETGGYKSYTAVYEINETISNPNIRLSLKQAESGTTKLRELDVHYQRENLLEKIIQSYIDKQ